MKMERLLIVLPVMAGVFLAAVLVQHVLSTQDDFETFHNQLARRTLRDVQHQLNNFLDEHRRSVNIFVNSALPMIERIHDDLDDDEAVAIIEEQLNRFFPFYMAYTITRQNGERLVDFFMESVGEICQRDIETAMQEGSYPMFIHPGPLQPHIDIIVPWETVNGLSGMFLVSFRPDILVDILSHVQPQSHNLYLLRNDAEGLIEVSARGLRKNLTRDISLSSFERNSIVTHAAIAGTLWTVVDVFDDSLLSDNRQRLVLHAVIIMFLYILVAGFLTALGLREIRRRQGIEQSLIKAKLSAEAANLATSRIVSSVSHELRTPLNAVIQFSRLMKMDAHMFNEGQRDSIKIINEAGDRLLSLVNNILELSIVEAGDIRFELQPVEVWPVVEEVISWVRPKADERSVSIDIEGAGLEGCAVMADPERLRQVLLNLLSNAVKYNCDNGQVDVALSMRGEDRVRISITDTGGGISEQHQERLFEPFETLNSHNRGIDGAGIGLVVTKRLVEGMNGLVGIDSVADRGSTFWVEFPLA